MRVPAGVLAALAFAACVPNPVTDPSRPASSRATAPSSDAPKTAALEADPDVLRGQRSRVAPAVCQPLGPPKPDHVRVELWFEDFRFEIRGIQSWRALVVHRDIPATDSIAAAAVQAWIDGPTRAERKLGAYPTAHEDLKLLGIDVQGTTAQVDVTEEFHETHRGTCCEQVVLDTLIGTVTQFAGIERMQLWNEGGRANSFGGHGEFLEPKGRENDLPPRWVRRIPVC